MYKEVILFSRLARRRSNLATMLCIPIESEETEVVVRTDWSFSAVV